MRRLGRILVYAAYLVGFVLAVDYVVFWRPFSARLIAVRPDAPPAPPHVDADTMLRLGALRADRGSAFARFAPSKAPKRLRVCAFGDSFTYGDEVADGHDFPALLGEIFQRRGLANVEVLNFGNPWFGFHQTYILWHEVGRRFACDAILLGPDGFQPERDTTFNHTDLAYPYYLHARYVVDRQDVRLVEVPGQTPRERVEAYLAFWPRSPYREYDRNAPAMLRAMLPSGRTLPNPFYYYRDSAQTEARLTYDRLLRKLVGDGLQVLLFHALPEIVALANDLGARNLVAVHAPRLERYPYSAPGGHYSAFGNRWVAEQYLALLVAAPQSPLLLEFADLPSMREETTVEPLSVSNLARIELRFGGQAVGFLAIAAAEPARRGGAADDFQGSAVVSVIGLDGAQASLVDAPFVPVRTAVSAGDPLLVQLGRGAEAERIQLGTVELLDPRARVGVVRTDGFELADGELRFSGTQTLPVERLRESTGEITVLVGTTAVLRGESGRWPLVLEPLVDPLRNFRVDAGQYVDVDEMPESGVVTLVLHLATRDALETPVARYHKRPGEVYSSTRRLPARFVYDSGLAVLKPDLTPG